LCASSDVTRIRWVVARFPSESRNEVPDESVTNAPFAHDTEQLLHDQVDPDLEQLFNSRDWIRVVYIRALSKF